MVTVLAEFLEGILLCLVPGDAPLQLKVGGRQFRRSLAQGVVPPFHASFALLRRAVRLHN